MNGRPLGLVCGGLVLAAGLLWAASATVWYRVAPPGRAVVAVDGGSAQPSLIGVALLALAGIAAVVATAGLARRVVGGLFALAGIAVAATAVIGFFAPAVPSAAVGGTPGTPTVTAAPLLGVAGGLVLAAAGVFVVFAEPRLARFGARYDTGGARSDRVAPVDPDRAAWVALDEGRDPTADPTADPTPDNPGRAADQAVDPASDTAPDTSAVPAIERTNTEPGDCDDPGRNRRGGAV